MKKNMLCVAMLTALALAAAVPEVSDVRMTQADDRVVTIKYKLTGGPAVVTLDIETNSVDGAWVSIGGANISGGSIEKGVPQGDVFKVVEGGTEDCVITWRPDVSWPDHKIDPGKARAVVTAWATNDTPDYLVVDLGYHSDVRCRYYQSAEFLPGGLLANTAYRTTKMLMRKIRARDVSWTMGLDSAAIGNERTHSVTLDSDYYMGVFEVTQAQFDIFTGSMHSSGLSGWCFNYFCVEGAMRPQGRVTYAELREDPKNTLMADFRYPAAPNPVSWLGFVRARTGVDFDLPTEAQWEYACRGGNSAQQWGDGTDMASAPMPGRYVDNGGYYVTSGNEVSANHRWGVVSNVSTLGPDTGTAICGSYAPNGFGLYDMHGNVREWCNDWYKEDITGLNGEFCADESSAKVIVRGGSYASSMKDCRSSMREPLSPYSGVRSQALGFRVMCYAGLE